MKGFAYAATTLASIGCAVACVWSCAIRSAVCLAWRKRFPGDERDIVVAKSADAGGTWSATVRVHADAWRVNYCPDAGPSIKVGRDGTVHVAWWTGREGRAGTQYAQSRDGGSTFSGPVDLGLARHSHAAHIQLALGEGVERSLAAAAASAAARAKMNKMDPRTYINAVGAMQVVSRRGVVVREGGP